MQDPATLTPGESAPRRLRIVVADDNTGLLSEVWRVLRGEFDVVAAVGDGQALLEACSHHLPDVVVSDISMPVLDGFQVASALRSKGATPIVYFTVHAESAFLDEARALGALGYVLKGSPAPVLAAAIRSAFQGRFYLGPGLVH